MYSVIAGTINHPDSVNPYQGLFNYRSLKALSEAGTAVTAVSPRPHAPPVGPYSDYASLPDREEWGPYTVYYPRFWYFIPKKYCYGLTGISYARRIPRYVERNFEVPDLVHACHIYPDGYGYLSYVRTHDLPLFVVCHGSRLNSMGNQPPGVEKRVLETLDAATGVLCVSDALADIARRLTDESKVETVPIGANPGNFPVDRRDELRAELGVDPDSTVVLFVGQFYERKGIGELVEVLPGLDLENTEFVFVGQGGDMEDELRGAVAASDFSDEHFYRGLSTPELRKWFAVADLYLLPSYSEGRPTAIYEAMASETAVLATAVGGVPEQVSDGETGRLIEPRDVDALTAALRELTSDRARLRQMGVAGRERLEANGWTWTDHAAKVQRLHREALE